MTDARDNITNRLLSALSADDPMASVHQFALALKAEGLSQVEMYRLFSRLHQGFREDDPRADALANTMDLIWGWCSKEHALFEHVLSDEDLSAG